MSQKADHYTTIKKPGEGLYKEKGSKFFGYAFHAGDEEEVEARLEELKKQHHTARHHCYAWRLGAQGDQERANDDGEPANSAGKPILGQIENYGVTYCFVCVVRYFGGTKLGVGGLIQAYKEAAQLALENATLVKRYLTQKLSLTCDYDHVGELLGFLGQQQIPYEAPEFGQSCTIDIEVRLGELDSLNQKLKALHWLHIDEIE